MKKSQLSGKDVCKKCKAKCCKLGGCDFTKNEMKRVLNAGYPNYFIKISDNQYEVKTRNGACYYLNNDNLCSIQNLKTKMCWAWPVFMDFKKGKKVFYLVKCPLTPYLSKKDIGKMKKQISGYTKEFIDCNDTHMSDSEVKRVMKRFYRFKKKEIK